jgi:2-polyprenyl-3-methyl-5-hydroxy-6-metoxy-1,4-benzoquinol methylase
MSEHQRCPVDKSLLVRRFGFTATLHHGDPLVYDRWRWLRRRLPQTKNGEHLLDVGCGSGAFTIGAAKRGYNALGLSWDERNQAVACDRATICGTPNATFEVFDVRNLGQKAEWRGGFDVAICLENVEHIIDDFELIRSIAGCLKPGGRLLLTTPYWRRVPQGHMDYGPFPEFEDGRHVRRGYTAAMLHELCADAGLVVEEISYLSGPISQAIAFAIHAFERRSETVTWAVTAPMRLLPPVLDSTLTRLFQWPSFCIGLDAYKPRPRAPR